MKKKQDRLGSVVGINLRESILSSKFCWRPFLQVLAINESSAASEFASLFDIHSQTNQHVRSTENFRIFMQAHKPSTLMFCLNFVYYNGRL